MNKREIKKLVSEITDTLYDRVGFSVWWDSLSREMEGVIEKDIEEVIEERLNRNKDDGA